MFKVKLAFGVLERSVQNRLYSHLLIINELTSSALDNEAHIISSSVTTTRVYPNLMIVIKLWNNQIRIISHQNLQRNLDKLTNTDCNFTLLCVTTTIIGTEMASLCFFFFNTLYEISNIVQIWDDKAILELQKKRKLNREMRVVKATFECSSNAGYFFLIRIVYGLETLHPWIANRFAQD